MRGNPNREPNPAELVAHALAARAASPYELVRSALATVRGPRRAARDALVDRRGDWSTCAGSREPGSASSLNGPIGPHRRWDWARGRLSEVKEIRQAHGGTVNDVVLAAITAGFRTLLLTRDEPVQDRVVRTLVPVSVRAEHERGTYNNKVSAMFAELPVGIEDPVARLEAIHEQMQELKHSGQAVAAERLTALGGFAPAMLLALGGRVGSRLPQRAVNTVTTNVPGPQQPLYLAGRRMLEAFPFVPLGGSVRIGVAIFSYDGGINFGITGDHDHAPDIAVLCKGIEQGMAELLPAHSSARPRAPRKAAAASQGGRVSSGEQFARVGEIRLCFETFGSPADPAVLLVMGLGAQMILWDDDFCQALADRGLFVIRFDNRDIGRSSILRDAPVPSSLQLLRRDRRAAAYSLSAMATDAAGLLAQLEIDAAHLVGVSMGGMIAQLVAIEHPERALSLVSIMSTTGGRWVGQAHPSLYPRLLRGSRPDRAGYVADFMATYRAIGSQRYPPDPERTRAIAERCFDRGVHRAGAARQLAAIVTASDRTERLKQLSLPTTVIHGTADRLVLPSGGRATAAAVPGARLVMIPGMAHGLPPALWPWVSDEILRTVDRSRQSATEEKHHGRPQPV